MRFKLISENIKKDIYTLQITSNVKSKGRKLTVTKEQLKTWFSKNQENTYETKKEFERAYDLLKKKLYKLAGYYINCKKKRIMNVDFMDKINKLSDIFGLSSVQILALFIHAKNEIISEALKIGVYFDEKIFELSEDFQERNQKNSSGANNAK